MMNWTKSYKNLLAALLCTTMLQACRTNSEPLPADSDGVRLNIEVVIPAGAESATRASGHEIVAGQSDETVIDIENSDYCIMLFKDNALWQFFTPDAFVMQSGGASPDVDRKYLLSGIVHGVSGREEVQVVVLANWKGYNAGAGYDFWLGEPLDEQDDAIYFNKTDYNFALPTTTAAWYPDLSATPHRTVPMFGCANVTLIAESDTNVAANAIPMLRSLAKIEVKDATTAANKVKITNVSLTTFNTKGRFIPDVSEDSPNSAWDSKSGQVYDQVSVPSLPDDAALDTTTVLPFFAYDSSNKHFAAYVPEMAITDAAIPAIAITVQSTEDPEDIKTFIVKLKDEDYNTAVTSLLRNHIYRITVEKVNTPMSKSNLTLTVDVVPYSEVWLEPEFGLPSSGNSGDDPDDDDDDPEDPDPDDPDNPENPDDANGGVD